MTVTEKEMRRALGMDTFVKAKQTAVSNSWYIRCSVRRSANGVPEGSPFVYESTFPTISEFDAEMRLRKELNKKKLILWVLLDSHKAEK